MELREPRHMVAHGDTRKLLVERTQHIAREQQLGRVRCLIGVNTRLDENPQGRAAGKDGPSRETTGGH
jgi:hypothetical protein